MLLALTAAAPSLLAGCRETATRELPERRSFIAFERDFQDFREWSSFELPEVPAQGTTHGQGKQRLFVNALPGESAQAFPVGTLIVKEGLSTRPPKLFAMAKRGAGYNQRGAKGWEWFELEDRAEGSVRISWRGLGAPQGEEYGGDPLGTCNECHRLDAKNDYVKAAALRLR